MIDIINENNEMIEFRFTEELEDLFASRKIYFRPKASPKPNRIVFPKSSILEAYAHFPNGERLYTNGSFSYCESHHHNRNITVGRFTSISDNFRLFGERHPSEWAIQSNILYNIGYPAIAAGRKDLFEKGADLCRPENFGHFGAKIGNDVWIGQQVQMAQGVIVGDGSIIAAGSVVTKNVPPYTTVGGVPARPIKKRFSDEICALLLETEWWNFHPRHVYDFDFKSPLSFARGFLKAKYRGELEEYTPLTTTWADII